MQAAGALRTFSPEGRAMRAALNARSILVAPEFMRESQSLEDALDPKFLIVGDRGAMGARVAAVLQSCSQSCSRQCPTEQSRLAFTLSSIASTPGP